VTCFLPVPVDGRVAKGHGESVRRYQVQIDGSEVSCHDEIVSVKSKKQGTCASARQSNDSVPGDETVRVLQYFISCIEFRCIDFEADYEAVLGWRRQLIKAPSELGGVILFLIYLLIIICLLISLVSTKN
jgi:hypothetical protein